MKLLLLSPREVGVDFDGKGFDEDRVNSCELEEDGILRKKKEFLAKKGREVNLKDVKIVSGKFVKTFGESRGRWRKRVKI